MKKAFCVLLTLVGIQVVSHGQFSDQNWWYFGSKAIVDFSSGTAVGLYNPSVTMDTDEAAACYSDPTTGNLLFYTNGRTVYRDNHTVISSSLNGSPNSPFLPSSTQGALIIPSLSDPDEYYIFTTSDVYPGTSINNGLCYSIVDMSLSAGTITTLNAPAVAGTNPKTTEHLMAVPNCDNTGYWIIVHSAEPGQEDKLLVFELTSAGLSAPTAYPSFTVTPWSTSMPSNYVGWQGFIKVSPDGRKIAISNYSESVYLYNFDKQTGAITAVATVNCPSVPFGHIYGLSFSPNSNQLYISKESAIYQCDVTIMGSPVLNSVNIPTSYASRLQLGPDNKIYVAHGYHLSVINYPDNVNNTFNYVGYVSNAVSLLTQYSSASLPDVIDAIKPNLTAPSFIATFNSCTEVAFNTPNCSSSYTWNFGDGTVITSSNPTPVHTYTSSGTFTVTLTIGGFSTNQTVDILPTVLPISGPTTWCTASGPATYSTGPYSGYTYNWTSSGVFITPTTNSSVQVNWGLLGANTIDVTVSQEGCTKTNLLNVNLVNPPTANAGPTVDACATPVIGGSPTASGGLAPYTYLWSPASGLSSTTIANPVAAPIATTNYTVTVTDANGCTAISTCTVTVGNDNWHQTTEFTTSSEIYNDVITDNDGNVYVVGTYNKSTTLHGGGNPDMTISSGLGSNSTLSFVAKYDACANLIWVANAVDFPGSTGTSITLDENSGMVYITGNFNQIMRLSSAASYNGLCTVPNTKTIFTGGSNRGYIAQFDMNTGCLYFLTALTLVPSGMIDCRAITINENTGSIYVGGQFASASPARLNAFIQKFTPTTTSGILNTLNPAVWTAQGNTAQPGYDKINDLDFNEITNRLYGTGDFNLGIKLVPGFVTLSSPTKDAFVCSYFDAGPGCVLAALSKGNISGGEMFGEGVAVDEHTNMVYLTGTYKGTATNPFSPIVPTIPSLSTVTNDAAYMIGINLATPGAWSKNATAGAIGKAMGKKVTCTGGRVFFVGEFSKDAITIQGITGSYPFVGGSYPGSSHNFHIYTASYSSIGTGIIGNVTTTPPPLVSADNHTARSITTDNFGHCFVVGQYGKHLGYYSGTPASGNLVATGPPNAFVMRASHGTGEYKMEEAEFVEEVVSVSNIKAYPNPTNAQVIIEIENFEYNVPYYLEVYNSMGKRVKQINVSSDRVTIDLSDVENGIYLFSISDGNSTRVLRVSKTN